jgi:predicted dehydrogenase
MEKTWRIGLVGLDTSHCEAFTKLLNNTDHEYHVPGGKVAIAYPGGSPDFELSWSRVAGFAKTLQEGYGVDIVDSPEQVAQRSDAILILSADGRVHLEQFAKVAAYGKPVFIDKPLALDSKQAKQIFQLAETHDVPLLSTSSLRYAEKFVETMAQLPAELFGVDIYGPMAIEETQPGLFWYGIHSVEMLYAALGTGCRQVTAYRGHDNECFVGVWENGKIGTVRGNQLKNRGFGAILHTVNGTRIAEVSAGRKPYYASLLEQLIDMFNTGQPPLSKEVTVEIIRFIEAANESRLTGQTVQLAR